MTEKKRNPFKLRAFRGVNIEYIERLEALGIKTAEKLLVEGCTRNQREFLAQRAGIPADALLELVKLSDLARLPGVKGIRARLYYDAGVDSVEKFASADPEPLRIFVTQFAERTHFDGVPPLPKEVSSTVVNARKLPVIVEP